MSTIYTQVLSTIDQSTQVQLSDIATKSDLQKGNYVTLSGVTGTDVITATSSPAITSYTTNQTFRFIAAGTNTSAVTISINGLAAIAVTKQGSTALSAGDIVAGQVMQITYDGTRFQLIGVATTAVASTSSAGITSYATSAEAIAGVSTSKAVTPSGLGAALVYAIPPGAVCHFALSTAPTGFLSADGTAVSRATYAALFSAIGTTFGVGNGSTTFNVPDLRGEFIRGFDGGRGVDSGRALGSSQTDDFKSHTHSTGSYGSVGSGTASGTTFTVQNFSGIATVSATGGTETRPRNIALLACIKY